MPGAPVAVLNLLVVLPQLLMASDLEWWLTALLVLQAAGAVAVLVWVARDSRRDVDRAQRRTTKETPHEPTTDGARRLARAARACGASIFAAPPARVLHRLRSGVEDLDSGVKFPRIYRRDFLAHTGTSVARTATVGRNVCVQLQRASAIVIALLLTVRATFAQQQPSAPAPPAPAAPTPMAPHAAGSDHPPAPRFDSPAQGAYGTTPYPYVPTPYGQTPAAGYPQSSPGHYAPGYYAPPWPQTERNSPGLMAAGIVLTAASGTAGLSGLLVLAAEGLSGSISKNEETVTAVLMVGGVVGVAAGIVMILIGADEMAVQPGPATSVAPRILLAPTRAGPALSF